MTGAAVATPNPDGYTGILLAAGRGTRFGAQQDKLLQPFGPHGDTVALAAARTLLQVLPVVAVTAGDGALADSLRAMDCEVTLIRADEAREMSASLRRGVDHCRQQRGWLVALADMPLVRPDTIAVVLAALQAGADIVVPCFEGRRGHPVGFSSRHLDALLALQGDTGARTLLQANPVTEIAVDDPGVLADIDTAADLARLRPR